MSSQDALVFILCGQSNMSGRGDAQSLPSDLQEWLSGHDIPEMVWLNDVNFGAGDEHRDFVKVAPQLNPNFNSLHFGPELSLAQDLSKHYKRGAVPLRFLCDLLSIVSTGDSNSISNEKLFFIKMAIGSTSLAKNWTPANTTINKANWKTHGYYPEFTEFVKTSLGRFARAAVSYISESLKQKHPDKNVKLSGIFWMQGESDSGAAGTANAYQANLTLFIQTLRKDLALFESSLGFSPSYVQPIPFVMGKINWKSAKKQSVVNDAMTAVSKTERNVGTAETADLPTRADDHFNNEALLELGHRMASSFQVLLN